MYAVKETDEATFVYFLSLAAHKNLKSNDFVCTTTGVRFKFHIKNSSKFINQKMPNIMLRLSCNLI